MMDECTSQIGQDFDGNCLDCGMPIAASGCDGGSWVHLSIRPDRIAISTYSHGVEIRRVLANGVVLTRKGYRRIERA